MRPVMNQGVTLTLTYNGGNLQGGGAHGGGFNPGNVVFTSFENVACSGACRFKPFNQ